MILEDGGEWALLGTTVSPGFDYDDFELGRRGDLIALCPSQSELICMLTDG
jgi:predicted cupin superfamily sugar epimerase